MLLPVRQEEPGGSEESKGTCDDGERAGYNCPRFEASFGEGIVGSRMRGDAGCRSWEEIGQLDGVIGLERHSSYI
jgi:hypothetical protein